MYLVGCSFFCCCLGLFLYVFVFCYFEIPFVGHPIADLWVFWGYLLFVVDGDG